MRRTLQSWSGTYTFAAKHRLAAGEPAREFLDREDAARFLRDLVREPDGARALRAVLAELRGDIGRFGDAEVVNQLAGLLQSRVLCVAPERPPCPQGKLAAAPATAPRAQPAPPPEPPAPAPQKPPILLELLRVDDHFAPGVERLLIEYKIQGLSSEEVVLKITGAAGAGVVYEIKLSGAEKTDGRHAMHWDGKASATHAKLKGQHVHPLFAPYEVQLTAPSKTSNTLRFRVLYADIVLQLGTWTADGVEPPESETRAWLRWQLNELGYFGGPFTNDAAETALQKEELDRAIIHYKSANGEYLKRCLKDPLISANLGDAKSIYDGLTEDPDQFESGLLVKQIKAWNAARSWGERVRDFAQVKDEEEAKIFVPAIVYQKGDQFMLKGEVRWDEDARRLNDPVLPLLAKIRLLDKTDRKVDAPRGVGPARVRWRVEDPAEPDMAARYEIDIRHDPAQPSDDKNRLQYMEKVQTDVVQTKTYADGSAFEKNCPVECGGKDLPGLFMSYRPFPLTTPGNVPTSEASTDASARWSKVLGMTGVNFRPTKIAGDSFRVIADLDFSGLGNKADLEASHGADAQGRDAAKVETGVITIWRESRFRRIVTWHGTAAVDYGLPDLRRDFEHCYVRMTCPGPGDSTPITDLISDSEYQQVLKCFQPANLQTWLEDASGPDDEAYAGLGASEAARVIKDATPGREKVLGIPLWRKFHLTADCLYGRDLPPQKDLPGDQYKLALTSLLYHSDQGFVNKVSEPLALLVSKKVRPQDATTEVVMAFRAHAPVQIWTDGADHSQGSQVEDSVSYTSCGCADGIVAYDVGDEDRRSYVVAHEFGHHYFLYHHEGAGDQNPDHHDEDDNNCIMSYPDGTAPKISKKYNPLFCGKCNLRLRGWKVTAVLPAGSGP